MQTKERIIEKKQSLHLRRTVRWELSRDHNSATGLGSMSLELAEAWGFKKRGLCVGKTIFHRKISAVERLGKNENMLEYNKGIQKKRNLFELDTWLTLL